MLAMSMGSPSVAARAARVRLYLKQYLTPTMILREALATEKRKPEAMQGEGGVVVPEVCEDDTESKGDEEEQRRAGRTAAAGAARGRGRGRGGA